MIPICYRSEDDPLPPFGDMELRTIPRPQPPDQPTGIPDPGTKRERYEEGSFWESDPDSPMMYREDWGDPLNPWAPKTLRPLRSRQRRRWIEAWEENGVKVGRASWRYRQTP